MLTDFMKDVLSQLTSKVNNDKPLTSWDFIHGKLIYHGDESKTLVPMHKTRYDRRIKFEKYVK